MNLKYTVDFLFRFHSKQVKIWAADILTLMHMQTHQLLNSVSACMHMQGNIGYAGHYEEGGGGYKLISQ